MNSLIEFVAFNNKQIDIAAQIIQLANKDFYPHFITKLQQPQQFYQQTLKLLRFSFDVQQKINKLRKTNIQFNHALKLEGKMIGVIVNIDIIQFYKSISHLTEVSQFYSLFKCIPINQIKTGQRVYQTRLSILPQHMGKGYGKRILYQSIKYLKQQGYHSSYQGILIEASLNLYKGFGCQILIEKKYMLNQNYQLTRRLGMTIFQKAIQKYEQKQSKKIK